MASKSDFLCNYCQPVSRFWGPLDDVDRGYDEIDLSLCFQDTVLSAGVCLLFCLAAVLQMLYFRKTKFRIPLTIWNVSKEVLVCMHILIVAAELIFSIYEYIIEIDSVAIFQLVTPCIVGVALFLSLFVLQYHRKRGIYTSGLFHIFWLLLVIHDAINIRTYSLDVMGNRNNFTNAEFINKIRLAFACTSLCVRLALLIITLFPDKIPDSWFKGIEKPIPEEKASFLSQLTWWWLNGIVWTGYKRALERTDLWSLNRVDTTAYCAPAFRENWEKAFKSKKESWAKQPAPKSSDFLLGTIQTEEKVPLLQSVKAKKEASATKGNANPLFLNSLSILVKTYWLPFLICGLMKFMQDCLTFVSPLILKLLIGFVQNLSEPYWHGIVYAGILLAASILQSLILHQYFQKAFILGMNIRTALVNIIYRKSLKLSHESRQKSTIGEIVNLMSVDAQRFMDLMTYIHMIWSAPFQILLSVIFLYFAIKYAVFAGLVVMFLLIPIHLVIGSINRKLQKRQMELKDKRIKTITEILNGIKVIKLYAWEDPSRDEVLSIRNEEMKMLQYSAILGSVDAFIWMTSPLMVSLASFATYVLSGNPLTPESAFVALALFNILRFPISMLPFLVSLLVECSVSVTRMNKFLNLEDLDPQSVKWKRNPAVLGEAAIQLSNANFSWQKQSTPILQNISIRVDPSSLLSVIGQVGSGKSSFLMALLGEMEKQKGEARVQGTVAYVPQIAWMQNASLKDNILFGAPEQPDRYQDVLRACALETDIQILPTGDQTEIGEKGINLSGGQKQRVSLARAVYQDCDVYFLDDTLSAVDAHVGQHIYEEVIGPNGLLKNKTRIFVTHNLNYVSESDSIAMFQDGRIVEQGNYAAVMRDNGGIAQLINNFVHHDNGVDAATENDEVDEIETLKSPEGVVKELGGVDKKDDTEKAKSEKGGNLIDEEKADSGRVNMSVVFAYVKSVGLVLSVLILLALILTYAASGGTSIWLAYWSNQYTQGANGTNATNVTSTDPEVGLYLGVYGGLGIVQGLFTFVSSFLFAFGAIFASRHLHKIILLNILRCPMSFFDTTPIGRIMNRFSKDIYYIDETIPSSIREFLWTFFTVVITIIIISYATPLFLTVVIPLLIFYLCVQRFYVASSRQLKRIESITRSPIYAHFQESLTGVCTIRGYKRQNDFILENERRVDHNQEVYYPSICANRWLAIRLEFAGHFVVFFAALFAVISRQLHITNAGLIGLSISYALNITLILNWLVRMTSELEANIVSVERVKEYAELKTEASAVTENINLPANWPQQGVVQFNQYSVRYRPDLDVVIDKLDLEVKGSQKLAVVGRTGAGKSSLTLALFRILEAAEGNIMIDGVNIADVGLSDLRSRLTIIPQDPVLFSGTIRSNLDPFSKHKI